MPVGDSSGAIVGILCRHGVQDSRKVVIVVEVPVLLGLFDLGHGQAKVADEFPLEDALHLELGWVCCVHQVLPVRVVQIIVQPIKRISEHSCLLLLSNRVVSEEVLVNLIFSDKITEVDLFPDALLDDLTAESVIHDRVQQSQVHLPDLLWLLCHILLVPHSE